MQIMANTANLLLPYLEASQAQKEVTVNSTLTKLDALVMISVKDRDLNTPPVSPSEGHRYIVASSPTGSWSGQFGKIAAYQNGGWVFYTPKIGFQAYVEDENIDVFYTGSSWNVIGQDTLISKASGEFFKINRKEVDVTLGSGSSITVSNFINNRAIVFGIACRVMTAVTGATSFNIGLSGENTKFGGSIGVLLDSTNIGVINPQAFFANTNVLIAANGGNFSGGSVKLIQHYAEMKGNWTW
jgi:hypothetical protein